MADRDNPGNAELDEMIDESFPASDPPSYSGTTAGPPARHAELDAQPTGLMGTSTRLIGVAVATIAVLGAGLAFLLRPRRRDKRRGRYRR